MEPRYRRRMRIALPTCVDLPKWEVDDVPLHIALAKRGFDVVQPIWDDPNIDWSLFRACLLRTTWDHPAKRDAFVSWAKRVSMQTTLFNSFEIVRLGTNKRYLRDLERCGLPVTPTVWLEPGQLVDLKRILSEHGWQKAFLKPAIGSTSRETLRFEATPIGLATADAHLHRMLRSETMLLQPYLKSVETLGELSAIFFDGRFSHAVRKIPVPGDYRVQDDYGASDEPTTLQNDEFSLAQQCVAAVDVDNSSPLLYARVDFLRDDQGALRLNELELVDPSLFFRHAPQAAETLAEAFRKRLESA